MSNKFVETLKVNAPKIMIFTGAFGLVTTTVLAVKATPKASQLCAELKREKKRPTVKDYAKVLWKPYLPSIVVGSMSLACIFSGVYVDDKRNAAIATSLALTQTAFSDYKNKVLEDFGEAKEKRVKDEIAQDKVRENPPVTPVYNVTNGITLCYDVAFGQYFKSDIETIRRAVNHINREIMYGEMYQSLNDFYDEIGAPRIKVGDYLGWNVDDKEIDITFSSCLSENNVPCLAIEYTTYPKYNYSNFI